MLEMLISQVVLVGKGKITWRAMNFHVGFFWGARGFVFFVGGKIPKKTHPFSGS